MQDTSVILCAERGPTDSRPSTRAKAATPKEEYPFIETLRGFASIFVLLTHTRNWIFEITTLSAVNKLLLPFYFLTALAREGVIVFFVVSGFLVGGRTILDMEAGRFSTIRYFAARFSRIYIAYVPALIVALLILETLWSFDPIRVDAMGRELLVQRVPMLGGVREVACHLANLQGVFCPYTPTNPALWSLGYEWVLYVIAPVLFYALVRSETARGRALIVAWLLLGIVALLINPLHAAILFGIWFLSAISYRYYASIGTPRVIAFGALGVFCLLIGVSRLKIWNPYLTDALIGISLAAAMSGRAVLMLDILPCLSRFLASFSFSLYVTHLPVAFAVLFIMRELGFAAAPAEMAVSPMLQYALLVTCCILFAYAFSRLTEAHTARFRRWLLRNAPSATLQAKAA